jgi:phospholipase D1/2
MLDPSTNANPLVTNADDPEQETKVGEKQKSKGGDVSKHIFYIVNSQMGLKLVARNEVC